MKVVVETRPLRSNLSGSMRPTYPSISLGLLPAAVMRVGWGISAGMMHDFVSRKYECSRGGEIKKNSPAAEAPRSFIEADRSSDQGQGCGVGGVGGVPGIIVGGPGTLSGPGAPGITEAGVPGVPGV
jgi:hypothetical protein